MQENTCVKGLSTGFNANEEDDDVAVVGDAEAMREAAVQSPGSSAAKRMAVATRSSDKEEGTDVGHQASLDDGVKDDVDDEEEEKEEEEGDEVEVEGVGASTWSRLRLPSLGTDIDFLCSAPLCLPFINDDEEDDDDDDDEEDDAVAS